MMHPRYLRLEGVTGRTRLGGQRFCAGLVVTRMRMRMRMRMSPRLQVSRAESVRQTALWIVMYSGRICMLVYRSLVELVGKVMRERFGMRPSHGRDWKTFWNVFL